MDFYVARAELRFDSRDLPVATRDSCSDLSPFFCDFIKGTPVSFEHGLLPVYCCQRRTITSTYFGSSSTP